MEWKHTYLVSYNLALHSRSTWAKFDDGKRYYLSDLLDLVGITNGSVKSRINVGIACWGLGVSTIVALIVPRFRRRPIYLLTASSLLVVYIAWTISMERYMSTETQAAAILTIFFIFMYTPAYVMGYNALTYS